MISPSAHQLNCLLVCSMSTDVTSWRDGGGRAMAPTLSGEGAVDGGSGGGLVMDGAAGVPTPNSQSHGPPRIPPAGNPVLPLPQPPVGPGFPQYRGIMPPFVSTSLPYIFFCLQTSFIFYGVTGLNKARTALLFALLQKCNTKNELCLFFEDVSSLHALPGSLWPSGAVQVPSIRGRTIS